MKTQLFATFATALALTGVFASSAQAAGFSFKTNYTADLAGDDMWKGNIWLESIEFSGQTVSEFSIVKDAKIVSNDLWTGGNSGAASADMGDEATVGLKQEELTEAGAVAALGNLNLNSIIDTEDSGNFAIDVMFDKAVDNILVWERGKNSKLDVQAIDSKGNLIGNLINLPKSNNWTDAGYSIDTKEISGAQKVASIGLSLADFGLSANDSIFGYRMMSQGSSYNGPDWKILGTTDATPASVPEPTSVIGLGLVAGSFVASRRRQKSK
ncbi:PEP-CTERM -sorting domain protein [Lyngbya aestuarii BL J]|uniref:PEP-CTERM-sorting domain protein n=1 Tax=Lyngbya aestuarii BL J TaxID=1348334 RepID=U7QCL2_9CYAN|nr:exosortase-dependent surface protein XDP2 [Lyngbya aestuarii]ERT05573.1 PEP-CTERM -sorting domain protein [Lyngbya aestuarii BL J]